MKKRLKLSLKHWEFYLKFYKGAFQKIWICIILSIFQSFILLPVVILIKNIFDNVIPEKNFSDLFLFSLLILIIYFINGIISLLTRYISLKTTKTVIWKLRDKILEKIISLPKKILTGEKKAKFHTIWVQDTLRIDIMSNALLSQIIPSLFISLGLLGILFYLNFLLFSVLIILSPPIFFFGRYTGKIIKIRIRKYHRYFEKFTHKTMIFMDFIDFIRIRSNEEKEMVYRKQLHADLNEKSFSQAWMAGIYSISNKTMIGISGIIVLLAGGYLIERGNLSTGSLISFFAAAGILKNYLVVISNVIPKVLEGNESLKTVYDLMNIDEKIPYSGKIKIKFKGKIEVENVCFRYGHSEVLENFSLTINPGEIVSLVGPNGSGKTSLAYLELGFYKPDSGTIYADGIPYEKLDIKYLRKFIGFVNQDPYIFPGTIYENLIFGLGSIPMEKVGKALELSLCDQFIRKKSLGIHTFIGSGGAFLSRGEIQRIALARVMLGDYKYIILDEPGNHLDEGIIKYILNNFKKLELNPSMLLITHSNSIAKISDVIVYMEKFGNR